ncbi:inactive peptidyl-prolyl cis-trans isomerase shutdown-like [Spodoptera frugiperda]|uniref:Inactive peptidyl-prolyl cis-trans isomerase shutdown-like n=1 Tax=Spodoptera frugiperda TaxID=7108 RepID=A0A9R0E1A0_SPOFR|nr:inactive peptidyl-prolyl cis-trans isomerase shutdown-like [Spodoptera frugiperda]
MEDSTDQANWTEQPQFLNVPLAKGINKRELLETGHTEFTIDFDYNKKESLFDGNDEDEMFTVYDEEDNDDGDALKSVDKQAENMLLASPEYQSFEQLAAKMTDCLSNGSVKGLLIFAGDGPLVSPESQVLLHYAAYYERSEVPFDTSLTSSSGTAVGLPRPSAVSTNVRHIFRFNDLPSSEQMKFETTVTTIKDIRAVAKDLFKRKKYTQAIRNYEQGISILSMCQPQNEEELKVVNDLKVTIFVNLATCYYKIDRPKNILGVCKHINRIIDINTHCKALFYYGRAQESLARLEEAVLSYKKALKIEPKNKEIGKALADLDARIKKAEVDEKKMWRKALNRNTVMPLPEEAKIKKVCYVVDEDFKDGVFDMCQDLAGREEYAKFDLPPGLTKDEVACIKELTSEFEGLTVLEDGEGKRKKVSIVKQIL